MADAPQVLDPIGRTIEARWLRSDDGLHAVVEMAEASGLSRLTPAERDPIGASSVGTGQLLRAAIDAGAHHVILGIGGSATTDGGRGLLDGLGIDDPAMAVALAAVEVEVACDVDNPLLGPRGAAAVYGPQKGATPDDVIALDFRNAAWARRARGAVRPRRARDAGRRRGRWRRVRAAHRAGPVPRLLAATRRRAADGGGRLRRAPSVAPTSSSPAKAGSTAQTAFGKTALGVARRAQAAGVPCIAVGGGVEPDGIAALAAVGAIAVPVVERPQSVEAAMAAGADPLVRCGERIARLVSLA